MYSVYSLDTGKKGTMGIFAALIVLKIIFVDIWTSLGDAITDFLQGLYLMFDFYDGFAWKYDTYEYGVIVLIACWVPGIVAVIHIMAYYRCCFFSLFLLNTSFAAGMSSLDYQKICHMTSERQG